MINDEIKWLFDWEEEKPRRRSNQHTDYILTSVILELSEQLRKINDENERISRNRRKEIEQRKSSRS